MTPQTLNARTPQDDAELAEFTAASEHSAQGILARYPLAGVIAAGMVPKILACAFREGALWQQARDLSLVLKPEGHS